MSISVYLTVDARPDLFFCYVLFVLSGGAGDSRFQLSEDGDSDIAYMATATQQAAEQGLDRRLPQTTGQGSHGRGPPHPPFPTTGPRLL